MESANVMYTRTGNTASPQVTKLGKNQWHLEADFSHAPIESTMRFDGDFLAEAKIDSDGHTVELMRIDV